MVCWIRERFCLGTGSWYSRVCTQYTVHITTHHYQTHRQLHSAQNLAAPTVQNILRHTNPPLQLYSPPQTHPHNITHYSRSKEYRRIPPLSEIASTITTTSNRNTIPITTRAHSYGILTHPLIPLLSHVTNPICCFRPLYSSRTQFGTSPSSLFPLQQSPHTRR